MHRRGTSRWKPDLGSFSPLRAGSSLLSLPSSQSIHTSLIASRTLESEGIVQYISRVTSGIIYSTLYTLLREYGFIKHLRLSKGRFWTVYHTHAIRKTHCKHMENVNIFVLGWAQWSQYPAKTSRFPCRNTVVVLDIQLTSWSGVSFLWQPSWCCLEWRAGQTSGPGDRCGVESRPRGGAPFGASGGITL